VTTLWSAHNDAERLAEQVQVLQGEVVKLQEQGEENQRLKGLLDLKDRGTFPAGTDFVMARVVAKSPSRWQSWIQIDKGSADGLRLDQAVVGATPAAGASLVGKGLVGQIVEITAHAAKVQLITDSESSVAAKVQGSRAEGMVEGSMSGELTMDYVDRDIMVTPKLVVVTSGFGPIYPADIPIGIVSNVGEEDVNIYKDIEVQPFVDFRVLEEVMVLIVPETTDEVVPDAGVTQPWGTTMTFPWTASTTTTTVTPTTTTSGTTTTTETSRATTTTKSTTTTTE
jgi:rod shape-determining protein MreC